MKLKEVCDSHFVLSKDTNCNTHTKQYTGNFWIVSKAIGNCNVLKVKQIISLLLFLYVRVFKFAMFMSV